MAGLGDLPGGRFQSFANAVTADVRTVVGSSESDFGAEAFIWDAAHGMRRLQDALLADYGLELPGWSLVVAEGISADGRVIVGSGESPRGNFEGWVVVVPEPGGVGLVVGGGGLLCRRWRRRA
jgi:hypothetical protein